MEIMKKLRCNQNHIIQGLFVSLAGGWCLSAFLRGASNNFSILSNEGTSELALVLSLFLGCTVAFFCLYCFKENIAKVVMFFAVYLFIIATAYNAYNVPWESFSYNKIGGVCFLAVLCALVVLTFMYVKEDIFELLGLVKIGNRTTVVIVTILGVALFAFVGAVTVLRYRTYSSSTFDFGIFAQMYEYMRQKGTMETTLERNYLLSHFGVHFSPIYYLGLPIYFIFPSPVTVQLLQALMLALPMLPIVLLCRHFEFSNRMTIGLALLYMLYPAVSAGSFYDIHENCFLIFGILMTVWAAEKKRNIMLILFVLFTFLVKEDAAFYIFVLGVFFLLSGKDRKRGLILSVISLLYFAIAVSIVQSYGLGVMESRWKNLFIDKEGGLLQIIQTVLTNPAYAVSQMIADTPEGGMHKLQYIMLMLIPLAGVLFATGKKYSRYILFVPFILYNLITVYEYMHDITFQYNFGVSALFIYVIMMNVSDMEHEKARTLMCISVLCAAIMFLGSVYPKLGDYRTRYQSNKTAYAEMDKALSTIPKGASVSASGFLTAHLSDHLKLWDQGHLEEGEDKGAEYLAIDTRDGSIDADFNALLNSGKYTPVYSVEGVSIYHRN